MRNRILVLLFVFIVCSSQAVAKDQEWQTVSIPGICTFQIPPTLEIQKGLYKQLGDRYQDKVLKITSSYDKVVAQPKGINSFDSQALTLYSRVIVNTDRGRPGDYESLEAPLAVSEDELREIDTMLKNEVQQAAADTTARGVRMKILSWQPVHIVRVNGVDALKMSYSRRMNDALPVFVNIHMIQNNDYMHKITISYRLAEKSIWETDLIKVINSFKFKKR